SRIYTPPKQASSDQNRPSPAQQASNAAQEQASATPPASAPAQAPSTLTYRQPAPATPPGPVNWRNAIKEVGKVASLGGGGQQGFDINGAAGGDKGFAQDGPL